MTKITKPRSIKGMATMCARIAQEKLAENILILDLSKIDFAPADFFVICSCDTDIQSKAVSDFIISKSKEFKIQSPHTEGFDASSWIILDFFDVVVHIMIPGARNYYQLEKLWGDAKFSTLDDEGNVKAFDRKSINYEFLGK